MQPVRQLTLFLLLTITTALSSTAQKPLRIFMDCGASPLCDLDYIRQQLPVFDFVRDRFNADVQILLSTQPTGNGGELHTVVLVAQAVFHNRQDTLVFATTPNAANDSKRTAFVQNIKMGLLPYLLKNGQAGIIAINLKTPDSATNTTTKKDPWRNWAFMVGGNINFNGSEAYTENTLSGDFTVSKVTDAFRTNLHLYAWSSRNTYTYKEDDKETKLHTRSDYYYIEHNYVKSISPRWSWAYKAEYTRSTYSNYQNNIELSAGAEYNLYPYKLSSTKFLAFRYMLGSEIRDYMQPTIYGKEHELLYFQEMGLYAYYVQPWGKLLGSVNWYNYLHDVAKNNLSGWGRVEVNLVKGLSVSWEISASRIRDQMNLPAENATSEEVLLRLRSLSTSYNYYSSFGINYRFGSKVNNIVNARFTNPGN